MHCVETWPVFKFITKATLLTWRVERPMCAPTRDLGSHLGVPTIQLWFRWSRMSTRHPQVWKYFKSNSSFISLISSIGDKLFSSKSRMLWKWTAVFKGKGNRTVRIIDAKRLLAWSRRVIAMLNVFLIQASPMSLWWLAPTPQCENFWCPSSQLSGKSF